MALTTLSPAGANITQPLTTNTITTNFTTLPFLTLGNATTDLPFLIPDPSVFAPDPPSFFSNKTFNSDSLNSNATITNFDYTSNNNGTVDSYDVVDYTTEEESNPFLANDYNWYDYNTVDPNATYAYEPYDYSAGGSDSDENRTAEDDDVMRIWDGVNNPPPIKPVMYSAATDLNPWFLWIPPILCLLFLVLITLPCIILKIRDDLREKRGKERIYGSVRRKSIIRMQTEARLQAENLERQAAGAARPGLSGSPYSDIQYAPQVASQANGQKKSQIHSIKVSPGLVTENVLYIEENDFGKKKENGKVVSKRLAVDEPPVDYGRDEETIATRSLSKQENKEDILEVHRHSSSSGSLTPGDEAAASGETSLGSSSEPPIEGRAEGEEASSEEEDEQIRAHRSENFSTAPKTYTKFTGWNRDLYSNSAGFGPPARKTSSKQEDGGSPGGSADKDWGMY